MGAIRDLIGKSLLLILFLASGALYWLIDNPFQFPFHILALPIDEQMPLVGAFILPYLFFYPYLFLTIGYTWLRRERVYTMLMLGGILSLNIANLFYLMIPSQVYRSVVTPEQSLFAPLINWMHGALPPINAFPSEHTMGACLLACAWVTLRSRWTPVAVLLSAAIVCATVFLHQHFVVDLLCGSTFSILCFFAAAGYVTTMSRDESRV